MVASFVSGGITSGLFKKILHRDSADFPDGDFIAFRNGRFIDVQGNQGNVTVEHGSVSETRRQFGGLETACGGQRSEFLDFFMFQLHAIIIYVRN